jgi:phage gp45-like
MRRTNLRDTSDRQVISATRLTLDSTDDSPMMQQAQLRGFHNEQMGDIEHAHPYGFTARPKKPTKANGQTGGSAGASGATQGGGQQQEKAEAFLIFVNGNRSHGVAVVVADRRYRPNNLQEGEVALHDDQGQQVYVSRDRVVVNTDKEVHVQRGDAHALFTDGKTKLQYGNMSVTMKGGKVFLGKEGVSHQVLTVDGPSNVIFASIDETDSAMQAAPTAKRTVKSQQGQGGAQGQGTG